MKVAVVKYNAGNIFSVVHALKRMGVEPLLTDSEVELRSADRVIFPGQGEASNAMNYLRERGLDRVIPSLTQPVLGICIGQQLMCRHSEEGDTDCLGIFDAEVKRFQPVKHEDKIPHMGWNSIQNCQIQNHPSSRAWMASSSISSTASTCPSAKKRQQSPTTFTRSVRPCKRITSSPHNSIPKRAAR